MTPSAQPIPPEGEGAEQVLLEWMASADRGEGTTFEELCALHPGHAARLRELFTGLQDVRRGLSGMAAVAQAVDDPLPARAGIANGAEGPRYELRGEIARGGMGSILEIYDASLRRTLAMKVLRSDRPGSASDGLAQARRESRLLAEAQILAQLDHPGVVAIHEAGLDEEGRAYFTMKRVRGQDFVHLISAVGAGEAGWSLPRAALVLLKVCETVAFAHSKGVIHRDLKPSNVLVGRFGEVFVMDWGLAKVLGRTEAPAVPMQHAVLIGRAVPPAAPADSGSGDAATLSIVSTDREADSSTNSNASVMTHAGEIMGTPAYMPPEQARGELNLDARTDVYAVGAMLYHLLAGRPPYAESRAVEAQDVLELVLERAPMALSRAVPRAPEELVAICEKAMARDSALRYGTMLELADDLRAWSEGRVVRAHRTGALVELKKWVLRNRWAAIAVGILVAALASVALVQTISKREVDLARKAAEDRAGELRQEDYFNKIALAADAYQDGRPQRLRSYLDGCPPALQGWEWRHLNRESDTSDRVISFEGVVESAQFTPNGRSILTCSRDVASKDSRLQLWNAGTGCLEREIDLGTAQYALDLKGVSSSANGSWMATMRSDWEVFLWDARSWSPRPSLSLHVRDWPQARFAPTGEWLAVSGTGPVEVWDVGRRERIRVLDAGQDHAVSCWSPDGARLYTAAWDGSLGVWDVARGDLVALRREHQDRVNVVEASPDGRWIATGGWEKRVKVWDARTLAVVHDTGVLGYELSALAWPPDSSFLAVADGPTVRLLAADSWRENGRLVGHTLRVSSIAFDPDGGLAATAAADGTVRFWNLGNDERWDHRGGQGDSGPPRFSGDGRWFAVPWRKSGRVEIWSVAERRVVRTLPLGPNVGPVALSRDGSRLAVRTAGRPVSILDPWTGRSLGELPGKSSFAHAYNPCSIAFDPASTRISIVERDGTLSLFDAGTRALLWKTAPCGGPDVYPGTLLGGCWSPDGSRIVTLPFDGRIQVWNALDGKCIAEARGRAGRYWRGVFAPDGQSLYLSTFDAPGFLECWDLATMTLRWATGGSGSRYLARSADGERVFELGATCSLDVHDAHSGRLIVSLATDKFTWSGLAVSPVDDLVVTTSNQGVRFFDTRPWKPAGAEREDRARVSGLDLGR